MTSQESQEIARQAEWIYEHRLKVILEQSHTGAFVAIEPTSGEYFVGATLSEAIGAAGERTRIVLHTPCGLDTAPQYTLGHLSDAWPCG